MNLPVMSARRLDGSWLGEKAAVRPPILGFVPEATLMGGPSSMIFWYVLGELWRTKGRGYNIDAVLRVMVWDLQKELETRMQ